MEAINYSLGDDEFNTRLVSDIRVDMKETVLTPYTCTCLVVEILKTVLYEKSQLPYPYSWLKNAITKRKTDQSIHSHSIGIILQKYFNMAYNAYNNIEDIQFNMNTMMSSTHSKVQEVVILMGSTPYTPKEMFVIRFPEIARGHYEANHKPALQKKLHTILRKVFLSDEWLKAMQHTIQPTNTFIMVKKIGVLRHEDDYFEHYSNFVIPATIRQTVITINYDKKYNVCCEHLKIYGDDSSERKKLLSVQQNNTMQAIEDRNVEWYQAKGMIKGFVDFFIEKVSVSEMW